jgi:hypothetical protein
MLDLDITVHVMDTMHQQWNQVKEIIHNKNNPNMLCLAETSSVDDHEIIQVTSRIKRQFSVSLFDSFSLLIEYIQLI